MGDLPMVTQQAVAEPCPLGHGLVPSHRSAAFSDAFEGLLCFLFLTPRSRHLEKLRLNSHNVKLTRIFECAQFSDI